MRIGIVWQGNPDHANDRWPSFRLAQFVPLAELPGVQLISLQIGRGLDQLKGAGPTISGHRAIGPARRDFMETAAIMTHLDLVITPDTAAGDLAGGLGLQCGRAYPQWTSGAGSPVAQTPWYPTMRLSARPRSATGTACSGVHDRRLEEGAFVTAMTGPTEAAGRDLANWHRGQAIALANKVASRNPRHAAARSSGFGPTMSRHSMTWARRCGSNGGPSKPKKPTARQAASGQ